MNSLMLAKRVWGALQLHSPRVCRSTEGEEQNQFGPLLSCFFLSLSFIDKESCLKDTRVYGRIRAKVPQRFPVKAHHGQCATRLHSAAPRPLGRWGALGVSVASQVAPPGQRSRATEWFLWLWPLPLVTPPRFLLLSPNSRVLFGRPGSVHNMIQQWGQSRLSQF